MIPYSLTTAPPVAAMFLRAPLHLPTTRGMIEAETQRLIDVLDAMEPDPDLEESDPAEEGGDEEPSLGWPRSDFAPLNYGLTCDLELDLSESEPSLGSIEAVDQSRWGASGTSDREQDAGDEREEENEHGGDIQDEPHDAEEDKGAEEDEGPPHYYRGYDEKLVAVARAERERLDGIVRRRPDMTVADPRPVTVTIIGPDLAPYRVSAL